MKNPNSQNCPLCNYQMSPFDEKCMRCHGKGLAPPPQPAPVIQPPTPTPHPTPSPINRATSRPNNGNSSFPFWTIGCAILLALFFVYRYYISTPQYSLIRAQQTFIARDLPSFEKYVSIDMCTESLVDEMMDSALDKSKAKTPTSNNGFEELGQAYAEVLMLLLKPALAKFAKDTIRSVISKEPVTTKNLDDKKYVDNRKYVDETKQKIEEHDLSYEGIHSITTTSDTAIVTLRFYSNQTGEIYPFELQMRKIENYWQIVKVVNAVDFLKQIGADFQPETSGTSSPTPASPSEIVPAPMVPVQ